MITYQNGQFYMDGAPFQIHSGVIHYFRTLPQQWEDRLKKQKDCFIHLDNFSKGFVTVNGFNLGRFWNKGPQMSLYLPWPVLKEENEVVVYAEDCNKPEIVISDEHILTGGKDTFYPVTVL